MGLNVFQQATLAMMSQSHKLSTISQNVANINTDGYKRTDTNFETLISRTISDVTADSTAGAPSGTRSSDLGGVTVVDSQRISTAGQVRATGRNLDVAINGDGFFMVSPDINVNSNIQYTRRGSFEISVSDLTDNITLDNGDTATVNQGFLTDQFGNYVLGYPANPDGTFTLSGSPQPLRLDQYAFATAGVLTTSATIDGANLPADDTGGQVETSSIKVIDSDYNARNLRVDYTKSVNDPNTWDFRLLGDDIASISTANGATYTPVTTATYDATNPTAITDVVRFSTSSANGGVVSVFNDQDLGTGTQIGTPKAGAFAGLKAGDTITFAGTGSNDGTYTIASVSDNQSEITLASATPIVGPETTGSAVTYSSDAVIPEQMTFSNTGQLNSTGTYDFNVTFTDGKTANFTLDVSKLTQFAGDFDAGGYTQNGAAKADLQDLSFGPGGEIVGNFTDGTRRNLYKLPLAVFPNANGLEIKNGQNFVATEQSGDPTMVFADQSGFASLQGQALEGSNVDLGTEMTRLIAAQSAYNVASTAFKTADEMLQTAGGLKR